jgi:flagellar protein FliL
VAEEGVAQASEEIPELAPKKSKFNIKIIVIAVLPVLLLLGVQAGLYYLGIFDKLLHHNVQTKEVKPLQNTTAEKTSSKPAQTLFHNLPDMLVNLMQDQDRISYLKLKVVLEMGDQSVVAKIDKALPRILDTIQVYVRELRISDLKNSAGIEKFRQEILKRLNLIIGSSEILDVYFPTMVTQ